MATLAGADSTFTWTGTFGSVLAPCVAVGAILARTEHTRRTGGRRRWRWAAASPLLFSLAVTPTSEEALRAFLQDGIGTGALAVPLLGMLGGYAVSGRAPLARDRLRGGPRRAAGGRATARPRHPGGDVPGGGDAVDDAGPWPWRVRCHTARRCPRPPTVWSTM